MGNKLRGDLILKKTVFRDIETFEIERGDSTLKKKNFREIVTFFDERGFDPQIKCFQRDCDVFWRQGI